MQKQWSQSDIRFLLLIAQRSNSLDIKASNPLNIHEMSKNDWLEFPSTPKKWLSVSKEFPHCLKMTQNVSYFNSKIQTIFDNYARWNHHKSFELQAPLTFWVPERFKAWNQNIIIKYEPSDHNLVFKWFNFILSFYFLRHICSYFCWTICETKREIDSINCQLEKFIKMV